MSQSRIELQCLSEDGNLREENLATRLAAVTKLYRSCIEAAKKLAPRIIHAPYAVKRGASRLHPPLYVAIHVSSTP